jgi:hypothetical protein
MWVHVLHALCVLLMGLAIFTLIFFLVIACKVISSLEDLSQISTAYQNFQRE